MFRLPYVPDLPSSVIMAMGADCPPSGIKRNGIWSLLWQTLVNTAYSQGQNYVDEGCAMMLRSIVADTQAWDALQSSVIEAARKQGSTAQPFAEGGRIATHQAAVTEQADRPAGMPRLTNRIVLIFKADQGMMALPFIEKMTRIIAGVFNRNAEYPTGQSARIIPRNIIEHARQQLFPVYRLTAETDAAIRLGMSLWLKCAAYGPDFAIMGEMDMVWREFMLHSQAYAAYCHTVLGMPAGTIIRRNPQTCNDPALYAQTYGMLQRAYELEMGYMPGSARRLWPHPRPRLVG